MEILGTERYKNGRYGWQDVSYAVVNGMIEERQLSGAGDHYVVRRYIDIDADALQRIVVILRELVKGEHKTSRKHDELAAVLRHYSYATGYVAIDEIDWLNRKVTNAGGMNITPAQWKHAFSEVVP